MLTTLRNSTLLILLLVAQGLAIAAGNPPRMSENLSITGAVAERLVLKPEDMDVFPLEHIGEIPVICQSGANRGNRENLTGVPLKHLVAKAGIAAKSPRDHRKIVFIAKATDDYKVVYSWGEIFNSENGESVLVYYLKDGQPLGEDEGRFAIMPTMDSRTGARQVKWLEEIEVRQVVD